MTLNEKLDAMRTASRARIPAETQAVMQRSIESLRASGIMDRIVKVGQPAPAFTLPDEHGRPVSLDEIRSRGPVVLSFYRGRW